jgi:hypothetical protein
MERTAMSDYVEIINPRTMMCKLVFEGKVISEYKVEQCDKCAIIRKFDNFGYQQSDGEKLLWFCGGCR